MPGAKAANQKFPLTDAVMQQVRQTLILSGRAYTLMKIEGHGQAAILTQAEIELLFNEGLQSDRDRALFGVCL